MNKLTLFALVVISFVFALTYFLYINIK